jgi:phospholipase/carboxylesterase
MSDNEKQEQVQHLVVFLHGSGDCGEGVRSWVASCSGGAFESRLQENGVKVVWPDAQERSYSLSGGSKVPTWFDRQALHPSGPEDTVGVAESRAQIEAIIAEHRVTSSGKVAIIGFSQGGCLALHCAVGNMTDCVVCFSSFLPLDSSARNPDADVGPPVFMGHGGSDSMVPANWGRKTFEWLKENRNFRELRWKVYDGKEHELTGEMCQDALDFVLSTLFNSPTTPGKLPQDTPTKKEEIVLQKEKKTPAERLNHTSGWRYHDDDCWCMMAGGYCNRGGYVYSCCGATVEGSGCAGKGRRHHTAVSSRGDLPCQCHQCIDKSET